MISKFKLIKAGMLLMFPAFLACSQIPFKSRLSGSDTFSYKIKKIELGTYGCYGECPRFELSIDSDRTITYNALANDTGDSVGKFKALMDTTNFNSLLFLFNRVDFLNLKESYGYHTSDGQSIGLAVTYDSNKRKQVLVSDRSGPEELQAIIDKLFALRKNQTWVRVL